MEGKVSYLGDFHPPLSLSLRVRRPRVPPPSAAPESSLMSGRASRRPARETEGEEETPPPSAAPETEGEEETPVTPGFRFMRRPPRAQLPVGAVVRIVNTSRSDLNGQICRVTHALDKSRFRQRVQILGGQVDELRTRKLELRPVNLSAEGDVEASLALLMQVSKRFLKIPNFTEEYDQSEQFLGAFLVLDEVLYGGGRNYDWKSGQPNRPSVDNLAAPLKKAVAAIEHLIPIHTPYWYHALFKGAILEAVGRCEEAWVQFGFMNECEEPEWEDLDVADKELATSH